MNTQESLVLSTDQRNILCTVSKNITFNLFIINPYIEILKLKLILFLSCLEVKANAACIQRKKKKRNQKLLFVFALKRVINGYAFLAVKHFFTTLAFGRFTSAGFLLRVSSQQRAI